MKRRRRIAYFGSSTATDGGSELCLLRMAKYFSEKHDVTLFLPDEGPLYERARESGIETVNLDFMRLRRYRGLDWIGWVRSMRRARRRLLAELGDRRIELVHFNDLIDLPYAPISRFLGIPSVSHLRLTLKKTIAKAVYRAGVRRSGTHVLCVSEAVREATIGHDRRTSSRVLYDPEPDPDLFFPLGEETADERRSLRDEWGWGADSFVVAMVSKLLPNKGHLNFLEVARRLEETAPGRYAFLMIAGPTPGRERFEREVQASFGRLPQERRKWIHGAPNEEIPKYLRSSDLLLHLPDTDDSFPGVVLEAMGCGIPVLAHRVGGIGEQLEGGECGVLVSRGNLGEATDEVERLRLNEGIRKETVRKARNRLSVRFSSQRHFDGLEELYEELLG